MKTDVPMYKDWIILVDFALLIVPIIFCLCVG
jgi:hypothetical protein